MKRFIALLAAAVLMTAACGKTKEPEIKNLGQPEVAIAPEGGSASVTFSTNCAWDASIDGTWATISPISGPESTNAKITVTAGRNNGPDVRSATITIIAEGAILKVKVTQDRPDPEINISGSPSIELNDDTPEGQITFTANNDWTVTPSDPWIHVSASSGAASGEPVIITVTVDPNPGAEPRSGKVTITAGGITKEVTVSQPAGIIPVSSVSVDPAAAELYPSDELQLYAYVQPDDATDKTVSWYIMNSGSGILSITDDGLVTALSPGKETVIASAGDVSAYCEITVLSTDPQMVDLGLSVKWADRNLGARTPYEYGNYYAWGETEPKSNYSWDNYKWYDYSNWAITKYNNSDKLATLQQEDDAAYSALGDKWRTPRKNELDELIRNCEWTWKDGGYEVKGPNGNSIFLPAAGLCDENNYSTKGYYGYYWTATNDYMSYYDASILSFSEEHHHHHYWSVAVGMPIRAVYGDSVAPEGGIVHSFEDFNYYDFEDEPTLVLDYDIMNTYLYITRSNGTVDFNGHKVALLLVQNDVPGEAITLRNGTITQRLDGEDNWSDVFKGTVILDNMIVENEFYTDGHKYIINSGHYVSLCTFKINDAPGDVTIYGGTFGPYFDSNPDAGYRQGPITIYGGKFSFNPATKKGYMGRSQIIIPEGYGVVANPGSDSSDYPYMVAEKAPDGAVDIGIVMTRKDGTTYKLYWAEKNLGAENREDSGDYFAWGETSPKSDYSWETYKRCNGSAESITKYEANSVLELADDAANAYLHGKWRTPTFDEAVVLQNTWGNPDYKWEWKEINGKKGFEITWLKANSSIFLPAAGHKRGTDSVSGFNEICQYWTSSLTGFDTSAYETFFFLSNWGDPPCCNDNGRSSGLPIRAVSE